MKVRSSGDFETLGDRRGDQAGIRLRTPAVHRWILERGTHQKLVALGCECTATWVLPSAAGANKEDFYVVET